MRPAVIDEEELQSLYGAGWTTYKLAERYGCDKTTIATRLRSIGVVVRRGMFSQFPDFNTTEASQLYGEGWSMRKLAERYGCGTTTVRDRIKALGGTMRPSGPARCLVNAQEAVVLYRQGWTTTQLGKRYGCHAKTVTHKLRSVGVELRESAAARLYRGGVAEVRARAHSPVRGVVEWAIKAGRLIPATDCSECGTTPGLDAAGRRAIHGHHDDYNHPLVIRWLCAKCHVDWHSNNDAVERSC